jgi:RNA recognition motif-containing protein
MARHIQIGNLPEFVDSFGLQRMFEVYGAVRGALIATHFETGRSTGVGFVEMESEEDGTAAVTALNHQMRQGHILSVCWSDIAKNPVTHHLPMFGPMNTMNDQATKNQGDRP